MSIAAPSRTKRRAVARHLTRELLVIIQHAIHKFKSALRRWFIGRRESGTDEGNSGRYTAGKPVPVRPTPTHHLVAAKGLPPSDKTYLYPRD